MLTLPTMDANPRTEPAIHGDEHSLWEDGLKKLMQYKSGQYVTYTKANKKYFGDFKRPVGIDWNRWNTDHNQKSIIEEW